MNPSMNFKMLYQIFRDLSAVVHSSIRVEEVLELMVWKIAEVLKAKGSAVCILNLKTRQVESSALYGLGEDFSGRPIANHEAVEEICRLNKPVVIRDVLKDQRVVDSQAMWAEGIRMILDVPLKMRDDILGIIRIYFTEQRHFSDEERDFIVAIAEQCSCAIDKARLIEEQKSRYDHLALQTEKLSALGRMAAGIAHEINNPLGGILLFSTNMRKKVPEDGQLREGLEIIIRETLRCKGIIQDLLEFSRNKDPQKVPANINQIIERALSLVENELKLHHIAVDKDLSDEIPNTLIDENLMQQVFVNMFINAVEAIQEKGAVAVKSRMSADRREQIVEIEDTGCGISPEHAGRIFEPFFSTKTNGTGLGLAVSYGIVQKHKGRIQVSSETGKGTRFTIAIPSIEQEKGRMG